MIELHQVAPEFGFLLERGLRFGPRTAESSSGNGSLQLTGEKLAFRFTQHEGRTSVAIRGVDGEWRSLSDVLDFLGARASPLEQARVVEGRWRDITGLFGDETRISELSRYTAARNAKVPQPS
jgi:hypothetical protein